MIDRRGLLLGTGAAFAGLALSSPSLAADAPVRIASVKFGSLSWVLETIKAEGLADKAGLTYEIIDVPSNNAGPVALLGGGADLIVSDWPWAMRQRSLGEKLKFFPYSKALGSLVVPTSSPIKSLADLEGKKLGVAGSNVDKSWLLLRAYSREKTGRDIADFASPSFGAAPLLAEELRGGRIDASLNFWTFAARLEGSGFRSFLTVEEVMKELGLDPVPALVGFVWKEDYERQHKDKVEKVLSVVAQANELLRTNDAAWERLRPLIKPASDAELSSIIAHYRAGIPTGWGEGEQKSAERLMQILFAAGDAELMGHGTKFDPELFRHAAS